jgi:glycosyltransferase involved in cell wall biosynthesis
MVTLHGKGPICAELAANGIDTECAYATSGRDVVGLVRGIGLVIRQRPQFVVTRGRSSHLVGSISARLVRGSHVATEHSFVEPGRLLDRLVARGASSVVCVDAFQVGQAKSRGYRSRRIRVVPNGVLQPRTDASPLKASALGLPSSCRLFLCVGRLSPEKRFQDFIAAIRTAHQIDPSIFGLIAGDGPEMLALQLLASQSPVRLLGHRSDVGRLIQLADAVCVTSDREAMPMIILEAMARSTPVIATPVGGVPRLVEKGPSGIIVPVGDASALADAMISLDKQTCRRLGRTAVRRIRPYSAERMVEAYLSVFQGLERARVGTGR